MKRTITRAGGTLLSDQRGSGLVATLVLVSVLALGTITAIRSLSGGLRRKGECTAEAIASLTGLTAPCRGPGTQPGGGPGASSEPPGLGPGPTRGPALVGAGPIVALPFPGSVAVACTALKNPKETCNGGETGVRVQVTGERSIERSQTRLDVKGCPKQNLSVGAKLQVELSGKAEGKKLGGALTIFAGTTSNFTVTVSPDAADAIARGEREPPNPLDPTSLRPGEAITLSEEFYAGHNLQVTYRQLQLDMGFEEGRRLSTGVRRIDANTVRIFVGDADFVRQAVALGTSVGSLGISIGGTAELSNGKLRTIDIDISTPEGFDAYQQFVATGKLPKPNAEGTKDPTAVETIDLSDETRLQASLGKVTVGGVLADSEGHVTKIQHEDGKVETLTSARFNEVGLVIRETKFPDGRTEKSFSLLVEGADRSLIEAYEHITGQSLAADKDGNVRIDFTEDDLRAIREQALDQLAKTAELNRIELSREEIERLLREDPRRLENAGLNSGFDRAFEIASAKSPEEVLLELYLFGGPGSNGSRAVQSLIEFNQATARARNGLREFPKDHPESRLPGTATKLDCG